MKQKKMMGIGFAVVTLLLLVAPDAIVAAEQCWSTVLYHGR